MIIYLIAKYLRWLWGYTEPMLEDTKMTWAMLSGVETFIEVGILIALIIVYLANKGDK